MGAQNYKSLSFTYNSNENLTALVDKDGQVIMQNTYDTQGRVASQQDRRGTTTQFNYQVNNNSLPGLKRSGGPGLGF
jgi:uncharacterized protein RhaS with RHS repeats